MYWICKAISTAKPLYIPKMDIGAVVPVKAYKYGLEVPGRIKASFNRPRGGTCEDFCDDIIIEFSKKAYNEASNSNTYMVRNLENDIISALPDFELEELVISYIQIIDNFYLLSNSIAKKSTTIKIECKLISRDINKITKAVVQVKGGEKRVLDALDFKSFDNDGYIVYLYAPHVINQEKLNNCVVLTRSDLERFYHDFKPILPDSITKWESLL